MENDKRRAGVPRPERQSAGAYWLAFEGILKEEFLLEPLAQYTIFVEGHSDVAYLKSACEILKRDTGIDLTSVRRRDSGHDETEDTIRICTPCNPAEPARGGVPYLVRLSENLAYWRTRIDFGRFFVFVFDHDEAGKKGKLEVDKHLKNSKESLTLNPKNHITLHLTAEKDDVTIETLVAHEMHVRFFESQEGPSCWVHYRSGAVVQYAWEAESKTEFFQFVEKNAKVSDLIEVLNVIVRARELWGHPTPEINLAKSDIGAKAEATPETGDIGGV